MRFRTWLENENHRMPFAPQVKSLFENFSKRNPSIIGFHGTSLQTVRFLAENGYLPTSKSIGLASGGTHTTQGQNPAYSEDMSDYGIHLAPNINNPVAQKLQFTNPTVKNPYEDAAEFGKVSSHTHEFMDTYGLDFKNPDHYKTAADYHWDSPTWPEKSQQQYRDKFVKSRNLGPARSAIHGAVVLAISESVADKFKIKVGGDGNDINVVTNKLPIDFILGIDPATDSAYEWLEGLPDEV